MTSSPEVADATDATEERLRELIARGYQFVHPTDPDGALRAVVGVRVHDTVIDMVRLHAENDVVATRIPAGEVDILAPRKVLWEASGHVRTVLDELLALPDEGAAGAPANGCWVPMRPGASKWVIAST